MSKKSEELIFTVLKWVAAIAIPGVLIAFLLPWILKKFGTNLTNLFGLGSSEKEMAAAQKEVEIAQQIANESGNNIAFGWSPLEVSNGLYEAMEGLGTNVDKIVGLLTPLSKQQLAAVVAAFGVKEKGLWPFNEKLSLKGWLKDELSGKDLEHVANLFNSKGLSF